MSIFNPAWRMGRKNELRTCFRETSLKKVYHSHKFLSRKRGHLRGRCLQLVEKVQHSWAFSHVYGKISTGDERCWNEGNWIAES